MPTPTVIADVTEDFVVTKLAQSNLNPVAMSSEILEGMETLSKKPVRFPKVGSLPTPGTATFLDTLAERTTNKRSGSVPTTAFGGHVVLGTIHQSYAVTIELSTDLHTRARVYLQLAWVDGRTELHAT